MARTSPVHYIAPSAISITPNANGQEDDLAVTIVRGARIKVCYPPIADLGYDDASYKEWTLRGRNRRLAEEAPHTLYARLSKTDHTDGYLVFAAQVYDDETGEWQDPYVLSPNTSSEDPIRAVGADGERYRWAPLPERQAEDGRENYWWVRLGTVSKAFEGLRTLDLDTGILGTDQYNMDWYLDPDRMPEKPVRVVYEDRGDWSVKPQVEYTGPTGEATPDGTLEEDVALSLGWTGGDPLGFTRGQLIDEPYHWQHLTRDRWITQRLSEYNDGLTDGELYEQLTSPTRGWEEQNWVETSRVWIDGRLWECLVEGTDERPEDGCLDWKLLVSGGKSAYSVELTKSSDSAVIDPSGNVVGGYRLVSRDSSGREFYTYRFFTSVTVMKGDRYLHLCGAVDEDEEPGEGNFTVEAVGAGCDVEVKGSTCYVTFIWNCNDGEAGTPPYTSYNRAPEEYQAMRAMNEAVAHISMLIEGETAVTKDYRLQLAHLPTDTVIVESHNEVAAVNWSTKRNRWTNAEDIVIPLTASSAGQPVRFQSKNGTTDPDVTLAGWPAWLGQGGFSVRWADYDEDGDGIPEYAAADHMAVEVTLSVQAILRRWTEGGTEREIGKTNLLKINTVTCVDGVEYENIVPFTLNVTTDKAVYVLVPSTKQVVGTMIGGTWDPQSQAVTNARYSYSAAGRECSMVTCRLMSYGADDQLTEITSASDIHDALTFFINGQPSTLEGFRTTGVQNTPVAGQGHNRFDELSEIVFAVRLDGEDYESEGVPILRNGAQITVGSDGFWYIGGVNTEVYAKGTQVTGTDMYYTDPMTDSTPPAYDPPADKRGKPYAPYLRSACPAAQEGKFIHYVSITKFSDSEETYVYTYGTVGTGNTITVIHDRDYHASASKLTQAQLANLPESSWSESVPDDYSAKNKYLYARDTARYYKNGAEQTVTVGGISYPRVAYDLLSYWGQDGSGVEFAFYRAADDAASHRPTAAVLNQNHAGTAGDPVIPDWSDDDHGWYDDNPGFTAQGQVMYQSVNKYMGNAWSGWGDPVIIERYATDSVRLALDNEHEDFLYDDAGTLVAPTGGAKSQIRLYEGQTLKAYGTDYTAAVDSTQSSGATSSIASNGLLTVSALTADSAVVAVKAEYPRNSGKYYYARFTANKARQDKYDLVVKPNAIAFNSSETWADKTLAVSARRTDMNGGQSSPAISTAANSGALRLFMGYVNTSGEVVSLARQTNLSPTVGKTTATTYMGVYLELRFYEDASASDSSTSYRLCDYETVEIAKAKNGQSSFTSHVFKRQATQPATPAGGSYSSPVPSGWSDGVPDGTAQVWMSTRIFSSDGEPPQQPAWTTPRAMTDTADFDVEFSSVAANPGNPTDNPSNWSDTASPSTIWMATRECHNGTWGAWQIAKIKGENGADAVNYSIECADTFKPGTASIAVSVKRVSGTDIQTKAFDTAYSDWNVRMTVSMSGGGSASMAQGSIVAISGSVTKDSVLSMTLTTDSATVATKTVRCVADGADGRYEIKQYGRGSSSTSHADQYMDVVSSGNKWADTIPVPTATYPFIWQRSRFYDPSTGEYTSWQYARLTGDTGSQGKTGLWYQYAGVWGVDVGTTEKPGVTNTDTEGWFVKLPDADKWYMNTAPAGTTNTTTPSDSAQNWAPVGSEFKYYIAEAYFGSYAHFGAFIINGDWMISQYGTLYYPDGSPITIDASNYNREYNYKLPYAHFDPAYPNSNKPNAFNFCPNFAVDGKAGKTYMNDAYVRGQIVATGGDISGPMSVSGSMAVTGGIYIGNTTDNDYIQMFRLNIAGVGYGSVIAGYKGTNILYRLGYNEAFARLGIPHDAALTFGNTSSGMFISKSQIRVYGGTGAFRLYSNCWPTRDQAEAGEVYNDGTYLRIKT